MTSLKTGKTNLDKISMISAAVHLERYPSLNETRNTSLPVTAVQSYITRLKSSFDGNVYKQPNIGKPRTNS